MAAGWPYHMQNVENAIRLPQHVPQRKQMPGGGQEQAGCPRPPPHTCCLERGSGPGIGGQKQPGLRLHYATGHPLPYLSLRGRKPQGAYLSRV